jgi:hypothetical protein
VGVNITAHRLQLVLPGLALLTIVLAAVLLVLANQRDDSEAQGGTVVADGAGLQDFGSVDTLQTAFNADEGTPRVVLLLSPT